MALHHASSEEVVDLDHARSSSDQSQTKAIVKTDRFEAIRLVLQARETLPSHQVDTQVTLHCLDGTVAVKLVHQTLALQTGQWVYFDADTVHAIDAVTDAVVLMTIMLPLAESANPTS